MCIRIAVLSTFAFLIDRQAKHTKALEKEVKMLEGILPICCYCKKIRDADNVWQPIEAYISKRTDAMFSHGFCPECGRKYYAEFMGADKAE